MKLELYIEQGRPLLVFPQQMERDKTMVCYSAMGQHSSASRAYLRTLKSPESREEIQAAWALLKHYANLPG